MKSLCPHPLPENQLSPRRREGRGGLATTSREAQELVENKVHRSKCHLVVGGLSNDQPAPKYHTKLCDKRVFTLNR